MIKVNVCCVPSVSRLHETVAQSVKIVVQEDMAMVAKNAKLASIVPLRQTILRHVLAAVLEGINLTMVKQAVFHVHLESTSTLKEKRHVQIVRWDVQLIS